MKVAVTPYEATGHVNPLLALCKKLKERGHEVQFFIVTDLYEKELLQLGFETHLFGEERGVRHTPQSMFELIPMYQDQDETDSKYPLISLRISLSSQNLTHLHLFFPPRKTFRVNS